MANVSGQQELASGPIEHLVGVNHLKVALRDWSLITGRGGRLQNGKIAGRNILRLPLKSGNFLHSPSIWL